MLLYGESTGVTRPERRCIERPMPAGVGANVREARKNAAERGAARAQCGSGSPAPLYRLVRRCRKSYDGQPAFRPIMRRGLPRAGWQERYLFFTAHSRRVVRPVASARWKVSVPDGPVPERVCRGYGTQLGRRRAVIVFSIFRHQLE